MGGTNTGEGPTRIDKNFRLQLLPPNFQDQLIDTSWRSQSQADSTPRFVETLTSSSQAWSQSHGVQSVDVEGFLRATQGGAREFEQTQTQAAVAAAASQAYAAAASSQGGSQFVASQGFGLQVREKSYGCFLLSSPISFGSYLLYTIHFLCGMGVLNIYYPHQWECCSFYGRWVAKEEEALE